ncbi:MAG: MFS transporter [Bacteroidales bacterium]
MEYKQIQTPEGFNRTFLMGLLMITLFFNAFMAAAVNIAIPFIAHDFDMNAVQSSWVAMSFLLSSAMFLLPFGKLGDIYGRKKVFQYGNILFTLSSLFCALAPNSIMLIIARFIQGVGGAMVMGTGMAIVTSVYPPQKRGKMLGLMVSSVYLGLTAAPAIAGLLTQALGWHSIFIVSIVAGTFVSLGLILKVKTDWIDSGHEKLDLIDSVIYMLSIFMFMYGFSKLPDLTGIVFTTLGISGFAAFVAFEKKAEFPVLNMQLFQRNRVFAFSNLAALINYAATSAITFLLSLYLQYVKGFDPKTAGMILITQPAIMAITAWFAGWLSDKFDSGILSSIGMSIIVVGLIMLLRLDRMDTNTWLICSLVVLGLGFGTFSSPNTNSVMSSVEKKQMGIASATISTMRLIGQITSMAIATMIIHIFLGEAKISSANTNLFIQSSKVIFIIFAVLCVLGVFASLARGRKKVPA